MWPIRYMKEGIGEPLLRLFLTIWNHQLSPFTTYLLLPDTKKSIQKKNHLRTCIAMYFMSFFISFITPAFSIFHVIWQWSWVCTISWVAELSIYTFAFIFLYIIILTTTNFLRLWYFFFMLYYFFLLIITLFLRITYTFCCCSSTIFYRFHSFLY